MNQLLQKLQIKLPIIQAPMAGVSTPEMASAVSNAGALGSIGIGAVDADGALTMIQATRALTDRPFNVNVFCHYQPGRDAKRESRWLSSLAPHFARFNGEPPKQLNEIYKSFLYDVPKLEMLLEERPAIVSFHFGLPGRETIQRLKDAGILLLASVTNRVEAERVVNAGIDAVIAQGYEAGGHRSLFDTTAQDDCLGTIALTRMLVRELEVPIIAAGGIMDGAGIVACLDLGASAAQLGTAFIACPESSADQYFREALISGAAYHTVMTRAISGREARCLANNFTAIGLNVENWQIPDYPVAYDAAKALHALASKEDEGGFGAQWAGQGAPLARSIPAAELIAQLELEMVQALKQPRQDLADIPNTH